jgi:uncharacterized membrane protein
MKRRSRPLGFGASFWWIPLIYGFGALALGMILPRVELLVEPRSIAPLNSAAATALCSSVASGMLALTGIVFSMAFVMLQFNATAYSPRLVLWLARDPFVFHAIGVFTATFLYALAALVWIDRKGHVGIPLFTAWFVVVLVIASVFVLSRLVQRLALLKISNVLAFVGQTGRKVIAEMYPLRQGDVPLERNGKRALLAAPIRQTIYHRGVPRIIGAFDLDALLHLATQEDAAIELVDGVGEAMTDGAPILHVHGGKNSIREETLRAAVVLGPERTFEQDPKYALRLLVDISIKALSPAINDPTTAVQALDYIEDLLRCLGRRRLQAGRLYDDAGTLRVTFPVPEWDDFVSLALEEIRYYGAGSIQVMRRMRALVSDLLPELPSERQPVLRVYLTRIDGGVDRNFPLAEEHRAASMEDRQGLGMTRQ